MKLLYFTLFLFGAIIAGYIFVNGFGFDNITFSNYIVNSLFIVLLSLIAFVSIAYLLSQKRKTYYKDVMTIRQYYQFRSAR